VVSVIGCGATMPATRPEHYWRMPKWHRFLRGNARYAPAVLPFIARACFGLARRIGKRAFMQKVLASAPADLAALEDDDLLADLVRGSEISVSDNFSAHEAFSREAIAFQTDWTPLLRTCPVAIMLFIGGQDPDTPFETVREYCEQFPHLRLIDYPNEGHFVTHTRWRDLLALIEEQLVQ
jgi:pimeloyl-ACP methyl ester carboxylesterase